MEDAYRAPQANGVCERFMGSLWRECLDHILIHEGRHLERVVKEYTTYFNQERPHQGIAQCIPNHYELPKSKPTSGRIISKEVLGGLHRSYSRTAYLN
jgi:putative transposase